MVKLERSVFDYGHMAVKGELVMVSADELISPYVGHSPEKTSKIIERAMGGVLIVNNAPVLKKDLSGKEALNTLLMAMEDYKDSLVVILAGPANEMEELLTENQALMCRIAHVIEVEDK